MWAGSDVCGLLAENVGLLAENVGLKHGPFAQNVSRTEVIFVGPRDYVCGPLQVHASTACREILGVEVLDVQQMLL